MPTSSIDMFFACTLVVSVVLIATAFLAGTMQTQINSMQDLNKQDYLRTIADHIVSGSGNPQDWGSSGAVPVNFGLSSPNVQGLLELDVDKVTRLNSQNAYSLSYLETLHAASMNNMAFGGSISQMLNIVVTALGNTSVADVTEYTFQVLVTQDSGSVSANLHCYVTASGFLSYVSNETSSAGVCYVTVELPNSDRGSAVLVVFARATFDDRVTAFATYPFAHDSAEPAFKGAFLGLSPFNHTLTIHANAPNVSVENVYAFSYAYQSILTLASNDTCVIPSFTDKSSTILVVQGTNGTASFNEWVAYPEVPLDFGGNFTSSEINAFVYPVTIDGALYKLTLRFGDVAK